MADPEIGHYLSAGGFGVEAEDVTGGVAEGGDPSGAVWRNRLHWFEDRAAVGGYHRQGDVNVVYPDGGQEAGVAGDLAVGDPGAADVAGGVVETWMGRAFLADIPAENFGLESGAVVNVLRGNFAVAEARAGKKGEAIGGLSDSGAPLGGADVAGVAREEPVVAGEILGGVLEFAVFGLVEVFDDFCVGGSGAFEVGSESFDENGEALGVGAQLGGGAAAVSDLRDHDSGVAQVELGAVGGVAVAVMLGKTEYFGEPGDGLGDVRIDDVRENRVGRNGAIFDHRKRLWGIGVFGAAIGMVLKILSFEEEKR